MEIVPKLVDLSRDLQDFKKKIALAMDFGTLKDRAKTLNDYKTLFKTYSDQAHVLMNKFDQSKSDGYVFKV